ncbi:hypothetical protein BDV12DRAFT_67172 [Aspergillus spectabilis]
MPFWGQNSGAVSGIDVTSVVFGSAGQQQKEDFWRRLPGQDNNPLAGRPQKIRKEAPAARLDCRWPNRLKPQFRGWPGWSAACVWVSSSLTKCTRWRLGKRRSINESDIIVDDHLEKLGPWGISGLSGFGLVPRVTFPCDSPFPPKSIPQHTLEHIIIE